MIDASKVLKEFRVTEKATELSANLNQYTFEVATGANKHTVAAAIEQVFDVKVARVNIINKKARIKQDRFRRGRPGRKSGFKKAVVTLKEGDSIELV